MAHFTNFAVFRRLLYRHRRSISSLSVQFHSDRYEAAAGSSNILSFVYPKLSGGRCLSTNAEWANPPEFPRMNAYDILGVSQTSSFAEIKASFRKLAKETHPDLARSQNHSPDASQDFIRILAAYEILSDSRKRAQYDRHIVFQRSSREKHSKRDTIIFSYNSFEYRTTEMEVVEWLKWYRYTIKDILTERRVTSGSGYFNVLERDFYSALHAAYYGPDIESMDLLPNCFEAEERSTHTISEVLHLVSGRELFGMVCLADKYCELSSRACTENEKLTSALGSVELDGNGSGLQSDAAEKRDFRSFHTDYQSDAYKDLSLHLCGRVVAVATRVPPKSIYATEDEDGDSDDQIYIYLTSCEDQLHSRLEESGDTFVEPSAGTRIPLGVIKGLGTSSEEGTCSVYDNAGTKTHVILKHRTLMVKHLHWFRVGEKFSVCECRCTRACLPPSKYWLFEPRSPMHDIGGWYIETFGRDIKGKTVPGQRFWDGLDINQHVEERLHPAVYLLALAYRTLDIEDLRRRKRTIKDRVEARMSRVFSWCRRSA